MQTNLFWKMAFDVIIHLLSIRVFFVQKISFDNHETANTVQVFVAIKGIFLVCSLSVQVATKGNYLSHLFIA